MAGASCAAVGVKMGRPHAASVIESSLVVAFREIQARTSASHSATNAAGGSTLLIVVMHRPASRSGSPPSAATYRNVGDNS